MDNSEEESSKKQQQKDLFYKQQQQRLQNISIKKDISADDLIRNILEKVDSEAKISKLNVPQQRNFQPGLYLPFESNRDCFIKCIYIFRITLFQASRKEQLFWRFTIGQ